MSARPWLASLVSVALACGCGHSQTRDAGSAERAPARAKAESEDSRAASERDPAAELVVRRECAVFIDTVNDVLADIQRVSARRAENEREMRRDLVELGKLYHELGDRLRRLELASDELGGFSREYLAMIERVQASLKGVTRALDRRDSAGAERARAQFSGVILLEDDLVDRINAFCDFPPEQTA